jgi:hypothetical protein
MNRVIKIKIVVNNDIYEIRKNQYKFIRESQVVTHQILNKPFKPTPNPINPD